MKILVFVEQRNGKLKHNSHEALALAQKLAGSAANVTAVLVGQNVGGLQSEIAGYGADTLLVADNAALANYNVVAYAAAVEAAIKQENPKMVLGVATPMGRDLFPRLAARMDGAMMTDVVAIKLDGDNVVATKPLYAGKCLAEIASQNAPVTFVTIRPNVFPGDKSGQGSATAKPLNFEIPGNIQLKTTEVRKGQSEKADLTEAAIIIAGGRALGSADNFKILNECADVVGATVGASRAAVDSGYAPHSMQVGQTGKTVNPNLYIACGISGSIQHMAGMRTSKVIVAVNTDADAPIFTVADYGIVADLFEAVPILTKKLKELVK